MAKYRQNSTMRLAAMMKNQSRFVVSHSRVALKTSVAASLKTSDPRTKATMVILEITNTGVR